MKAILSMIDRSSNKKIFRIKEVELTPGTNPRIYLKDLSDKISALGEANPILLQHEIGQIFTVDDNFEFDYSNQAIQQFFLDFFLYSFDNDFDEDGKELNLTIMAETFPEAYKFGYMNSVNEVTKFLKFVINDLEIDYDPRTAFHINDEAVVILEPSDVGFLNAVVSRCKDILLTYDEYLKMVSLELNKNKGKRTISYSTEDELLELKACYNGIIKAYEDNNTSNNLVEIFAKEYPFNKSFDELNIINWIEALTTIDPTKDYDNAKYIGKTFNGDIVKLINKFSELLNELNIKDLGNIETIDEYPFEYNMNDTVGLVEIWAESFKSSFLNNRLTKTKASTDNKKNIDNEIDLLSKFRSCYNLIVSAYDDEFNEDEDELNNAFFAVRYPFSQSFDELEINDWVESLLISDPNKKKNTKLIKDFTNNRIELLLPMFSNLLSDIESLNKKDTFEHLPSYPFDYSLDDIVTQVITWSENYVQMYNDNINKGLNYTDLSNIVDSLTEETLNKLYNNKVDLITRIEILDITKALLKSKFSLDQTDVNKIVNDNILKGTDDYYEELRDIVIGKQRVPIRFSSFSATTVDIKILSPLIEYKDEPLSVLNEYFKTRFDTNITKLDNADYKTFLKAVAHHIQGTTSTFEFDEVDNSRFDDSQFNIHENRIKNCLMELSTETISALYNGNADMTAIMMQVYKEKNI